MVKSCYAIDCKNNFKKGGRLSFYNFPANEELRNKWITTVKRENWAPNESTVICSEHFMSGTRSKNLLALNCASRLFSYVKSPEKRCLEREMERFERRQAMLKKRHQILTKDDGGSATVVQQQQDSEELDEEDSEE